MARSPFLDRLHGSGPPLIMGILNLTPDSFSDGGRIRAVEPALEQVRAQVRAGADLVDVGGESTRPGAQRVPAEEQKRRVLEVIRRIRSEVSAELPVSIDTTLWSVAGPALEAGADLVNDVSAGRDDPAMLAGVAEAGVPVVLMHMQGSPQTMNEAPRYADVVTEVTDFLVERARTARKAGVGEDSILLDPGIAFGKAPSHNLRLLRRLDRITGLGFPVLLGVSRKQYIGDLFPELPPQELVPATLAATALGVWAGVRVLRVHDVGPNRQAADSVWAIREAEEGSAPG